MPAIFRNRLSLVLVALFGLTIASWLGSIYLNADTRISGAMIMLIAFLKVRLIVIHYMELPKTFFALRLAFEAWVVLVACVTIALYLGKF